MAITCSLGARGLLAVMVGAMALSSAQATVRVLRVSDDEPDGVTPDTIEVLVANGLVTFRDPHDASENPEYYIWADGAGDVAGVAIALTPNATQDEVISIRFHVPGQSVDYDAVQDVGYVRLGAVDTGTASVVKTRVWRSHVTGDIGDLEVAADLTEPYLNDRWGTVEMLIEGSVTPDVLDPPVPDAEWAVYRPLRTQPGSDGLDIWEDVDMPIHMTCTEDPVKGTELYVGGTVTTDGGIHIAGDMGGSYANPVQITGDMNGAITIGGGLINDTGGTLLIKGDLGGSIEIGEDIESAATLEIQKKFLSGASIDIDGDLDGTLLTNWVSGSEMDGDIEIGGSVSGDLQGEDLGGTIKVGLELQSAGAMAFDSVSGVLTLNASCPISPANPWQGIIQIGATILTPEYYDPLGSGYGGGKIIPNSYRYFDQSPCTGDLDGDGDTDQSDLGILLAAYTATCRGDLDGDGDTDQSDMGILLADMNCN